MRTEIQVLVALVNIGFNLIILPRYSWRGAAWTSLGCDGLLVVMFWFTALYCRRRKRLLLDPTILESVLLFGSSPSDWPCGERPVLGVAMRAVIHEAASY